MPRTSKMIDKELYDALREYKPELTDSSLRIYCLNLMHLSNYYDKSLAPELFKNPTAIRDDLEELKYTNTTLKNKLSSIIVYLRMKKQPKELIDKYVDWFESLSGKISKENASMNKTEKDKDNWMSKDDLIKYMNILKAELPKKPITKNEMSKWMRYITLLFHINYPMRNELADMEIVKKITNNNPDINYLVIGKDKVTALIQAYKTKKTYKDIKINITPTVTNEILTYYKHLSNYKKDNNINNDWFLLAKNNEKMTRNDFTHFMQSIFEPVGKKISTTMIRKIIVSALYPVEQMRQLSHVMGHDISTAIEYYAKD